MPKRRAQKKTKAAQRHAAEDAQPPLVPMSEDELRQAGRSMATKVGELEEMEAEHAEERKDRKAERDTLRKEIAAIASCMRTQGR